MTLRFKREASKFEVDYVAEVGHGRDVVGGLTKQLLQKIASAAAGSKKLMAVHAELESHKVKANFLDEPLKESQKEIAAIKDVFIEQIVWCDAPGARMAELKNSRDEACVDYYVSDGTASGAKELSDSFREG